MADVPLLFPKDASGNTPVKNPLWDLASGVTGTVRFLETEMQKLKERMSADGADASSPQFMLETQELSAKYSTCMQYMSQLLAANKSLCEACVRNI